MGKGAGAAWVEQGGGGERDGILRGGGLGFHGDGEEARPEAATGEGGPTASELGRRSATACQRGNYGECATGGGSSRRRSDGHESWLNLRRHDLGKRRGVPAAGDQQIHPPVGGFSLRCVDLTAVRLFPVLHAAPARRTCEAA
jgi:hypothetical protein